MRNNDIFERSRSLLTESRQATYGDAYAMHCKIAKVWSALTGHEFQPETVALLMSALKLCRESTFAQADNLEVAIAYLAAYEEIKQKRLADAEAINQNLLTRQEL
jgi:hypothetical protein